MIHIVQGGFWNAEKTTAEKDLVLSIPGSKFHPISASIAPLPKDPSLPTWKLTTTDLADTLKGAWDCVSVDGNINLADLQALPEFTSEKLPYTAGGEPQFTQPLLGAYSEKRSGDDVVHCHCCGMQSKLSALRNHVGQHILRAIRDVPDDLLPGLRIGPNPCGWCGRHASGCQTQLVVPPGKTTYRVLSNCEYHYERMKYSAAAKSSDNQPCTNVPVPCPICARNNPNHTHLTTFWKYNLLYHMLSHHLDENSRLPPFPPDMVVLCHISREEESSLGIPVSKTQEYRQTVNIPGSQT
ncbi:hypothetical protein CC1G_15056 [Coprinopsis cinerea okayama7|uniref:Uncharacterized protein n=1 Tax=Coprinopsis cinerea (strain Okayama-7 / 130 / ATCC MYA-4618 / FGSC 9003) TaxID=240176 RepID=D6RP41_COPC7|nr:hypothetical protein CC1G_15056 [Coprinopsis cinerea okayama7\|eukprot:XP_002910722.1 hypothetical protein CC1G_15056 [Coprinopsis cinerea okayama7\